MNHKTAKCCENCRQLSGQGYCKIGGTNCLRWRAWFHEEWASIRRAAEAIKETREREASSK